MIPIKRSKIVEELSGQEHELRTGFGNLVTDIVERKGDQTMAFLVKKGILTFSKKELETELNLMVEEDLITIGQWENLLNLLYKASNGHQRVTNFMRKKRRFQIL